MACGAWRYANEEESFGAHGFSKQEFEGDELVDIEEDYSEDEPADFDDVMDFDE